MDLNQFSEEIRQEVLSQCDAEDSTHFREDKFTETLIGYLVEANEVEDGEVCYFRARGAKLSGFNFSSDGECLDLFVSCYRGSVPPEIVSKTEVREHFRWLRGFMVKALEGLHESIEEASPVFDAARQIYDRRDSITKARFFLLTDGIVADAKVSDATEDGIEINHYFWDIEKLHRFVSSGRKREVIEIDFADLGGAVSCIGMADPTEEFRIFLAFFPGALLAKLYAQYGPRLLEKNVRSFLQVRGKINKGIRNTILNEPHRFLAYNNGISATAEQIELHESPAGTTLLKARDFQIVNGGQTTASIYHAFKKDSADLTRLVIQVKLTVLTTSEAVELFVPRISQYANSQNKVNAADFSANDPYHRQLEELSRTIWAPAATGTERQTHWYYERARGQYLDDKSRQGTPARMRAFETLNPVEQKFTKTDLAKYENTWNQLPHLVSRGAEKNFHEFTLLLKEKWQPKVDATYFRRLVAKAILFKKAEKIVSAQDFGGYRANIVTYSLAWLSHHTAQRINLDRIWSDQNLSDAVRGSITNISKYAHAHITQPPEGRNVTEWCKKEDCWNAFRSTEIALPNGLQSELSATSLYIQNDSALEKSVNAPTQEEILQIMKVPANKWFKLSRWAKETDNLAPWQRSIAFSLGRRASREKAPSLKQAQQGLKILEESKRLGFRLERV
jgi:hypothetical protein